MYVCIHAYANGSRPLGTQTHTLVHSCTFLHTHPRAPTVAKNRRWSLKVKKQKAQGKRVKHLDALLQIKAGEMKRASYKSNALVFVSLALAYALLSQFYHGVAVCRLPFLPFPLIRPITHLGLPGQDFTECSMTFLYSLCSLSVTQSVQKLFGFSTSITPPSSSSSSPTSSISASTVQYNTPAYK